MLWSYFAWKRAKRQHHVPSYLDNYWRRKLFKNKKFLWQSVETYHQHYNYYYKWWLFVLQFFHNKTQSLQKIIHFTLLLKFVLDNITSIRSPILFRHNKLLLCTYECKTSLINITKSSWLIQFFMAKTMVPWNYVVIVLHIIFRWKCSSNMNNS